jgi:transcriptional regulator with XRE-family HTH domain
MSSSEKLGIRVCAYREKMGMTVEELASKVGLDPTLIGAIETGEVYPSINVMVKIARALGQRLGTFMDDQFIQDPLIVRSSDRKEETASHKGAAGHYHYFSLGKGKTDRHMEPFFIEIDPSNEKPLSSHEGEEFIIVVSGEVELIYGGRTHILKAGDAIYYNSVVPHYLGAAGGRASIYATIFVPF